MKVFITGASGFTGTCMIGFLSSRKDIGITALTRKILPHNSRTSAISWVEGDILNPDKIADAIAAAKPDALLHLAGLNRGSADELDTTNVTGTRNVLDAAFAINPECRILVTSSSAVYGYAGNAPLSENQTLKPLSEYGISKAAEETLCMTYNKTRGCQVTVARPFNLVGPHQPASFICGKIVQQVLEIEQGKRTYLDLLETRSCRDFVDVRDVVKAYWLLLTHSKFREECAGTAFNIGSGKACAVSTVIDLLTEITGNEYRVHISTTSPMVTIPSQTSDNTRIQGITGWNPLISLKKSLSDMLDTAGKDLNSR